MISPLNVSDLFAGVMEDVMGGRCVISLEVLLLLLVSLCVISAGSLPLSGGGGAQQASGEPSLDLLLA